MKMIKIALLGTAALAAVSVSARADNASDIAALKAQVEALSAKVASNEAQMNVPAGFQLMTIATQDATVVPGLVKNKEFGNTATVMSIVPTADAPASTKVEWSGYVKGAVTYITNSLNTNTSWDIKTKAGFKVVGTTDTAVGEVGARIATVATYGINGAPPDGTPANRGNGGLSTDGYWGWWKMTPELTLGAGIDGTLAGIGYGYDGACTCHYTDNANAGFGHDGDPAQIRLSYASGPMSAAIAVEDYTNSAPLSAFGLAGEIKYAGDAFSGELSGGYWAPAAAGPAAAWSIGAGVGFNLGDVGKISIAAGTGNNDHIVGDSFWKASILGSINLSDQAHAELAYSHYDSNVAATVENAFLGGIYYDPVKQLTIGLEGEYVTNPNVANSATTRADLVTVFRF